MHDESIIEHLNVVKIHDNIYLVLSLYFVNPRAALMKCFDTQSLGLIDFVMALYTFHRSLPGLQQSSLNTGTSKPLQTPMSQISIIKVNIEVFPPVPMSRVCKGPGADWTI